MVEDAGHRPEHWPATKQVERHEGVAGDHCAALRKVEGAMTRRVTGCRDGDRTARHVEETALAKVLLAGRGMAGFAGGWSHRATSTMVSDCGEPPRSVMLMVRRSHCPVMVLQV